MLIRTCKILKYAIAFITAWCVVGFVVSPYPIVLPRPLVFALYVTGLIASIPCWQDANKYLASVHDQERDYLASKGTPETFRYCSTKSYVTTDSSKKPLTRLSVFTSRTAYSPSETCISWINCNEYVAWLDDQNNPIEFTDPPKRILEDPAVQSLGCAFSYSNETPITPKLIFSDGQYWWETVYDRTPSNSVDPPCLLSGRSLRGGAELRSSVRAEYFCNDECKRENREDVPESIARLKSALENHDYHLCQSKSNSYRIRCLYFYLRATGDDRVCKDKDNGIPCDYKFRVNRIDD